MSLLRTRRQRRGAAAIETALVYSLALVPMLFAIMDYSWMFLQKSHVDVATREGLRLGVTVGQFDSPDCDATAIAEARAVMNSLGMNGTAATITTTHVGDGTATETLRMTISTPFTPLVGFPGIPLPTALTSTGDMLLELQD